MDSFQRIKVIGRGAFGAAVLVKRSGCLYVMKEVQLGGMSAKEQLEAQHEAKVLRELDHPYIVHYVDSGIQRGKLWIAMEYASGGDLDAYIQAKKRANKLFAVQEALGIFAQACSALQYLHEKRILHRDLKTKNIFLDKPSVSDATPVVKLGDFGISKVLAHTRALAKTQIGTPYYLSPEICEDKPYSFKSDVWAMGVVLYEILALRVPFEAKDMAALVEKILHSAAPKLPASFERIEGLAPLYASMLDKVAGRRPMIQDILALPLIKSALEIVQAQQQRGAAAAAAAAAGAAEPSASAQPRERAASASRPSAPGAAAHPALQHHFQAQPPPPRAAPQPPRPTAGVQQQHHHQQQQHQPPPPQQQRIVPKLPARVRNPPESQYRPPADAMPLRREPHDPPPAR
jgi:NIMA (never in mitosis gene a)-related kinase